MADRVFFGWLEVSRPEDKDVLLIFSVGSGDEEGNISVNLIRDRPRLAACREGLWDCRSRQRLTARNDDVVVVIPPVAPEWVTPLSEGIRWLFGSASSPIRR